MTSTSKPKMGEEIEIPEAGEPRGFPADTLISDHLTRAPPVMMIMQQREAAIGEEEGQSKVVLMNEPVVRLSEKAIK